MGFVPRATPWYGEGVFVSMMRGDTVCLQPKSMGYLTSLHLSTGYDLDTVVKSSKDTVVMVDTNRMFGVN